MTEIQKKAVLDIGHWKLKIGIFLGFEIWNLRFRIRVAFPGGSESEEDEGCSSRGKR